jgi:hypothetical protein
VQRTRDQPDHLQMEAHGLPRSCWAGGTWSHLAMIAWPSLGHQLTVQGMNAMQGLVQSMTDQLGAMERM